MSTDGLTVEVSHLTKRYGEITAVRDLSFTVEPGVITGFLGPNGAGKTTTMRMLTGLVSPTSGTATIGGKPYKRLARPSGTVGAMFDANAFHPGHTARDHLRVYAAMGGHPDSRVTELLHQLGLAEAADRRTRGFSTGMRQRLNLATALLGDPRVLLLDEPGNGLDPEGMAWLRGVLRGLAADGRTVLISSHVLSEVQQLVDDVVVIRRGELVAAGPWSRLAGPPAVLVTSPDAETLAATLATSHANAGTVLRVDTVGPGLLRVHGLDAPGVADLAAAHRLRVHELVTENTSLEQLFLDLTTGTLTNDRAATS
ncbi:ABC-2 type transport system ATP-binding protein [Micromonospora phaseoli]|uniref:ABC-2 type transport system ATP-binding protein n=1 Tax=Micromonospora phaseoli TaxID=1144548 RepID=A0A1H6U630_9ACTN|nr:ATP-binding cassette domain-containing protein [Micromonospora phaseoli]PZV98891.1 ABC-2 type transport system ATP-binding protein [Micromonospora phaseoli]GIJ76358.1 ABC transporter ATP-binding protein [Micromonospora phaseoli]SEI87761.1 ABC-2 type transport system ATP-binding protein [Micromonospora phaseoli]